MSVPSPPPPPGPVTGVSPPFHVPPSDGERRRRWWGIGLAVGATVVVCLGGVVAVVGLLVLGGRMITDQGRAAVSEYLTSIKDEKYGAAYAQLCDGTQATLDELEFARDLQRRPGLESFVVGEPSVDGHMVVPVTLHYVDGTRDDVRFVLDQDSRTGDFEVCGQEG